VFIVDDDAGMRRSIQDLLSSVALDSKAFATPHEFIDSKRTDCHGCMILDIRLPGMSGLDFQRELAKAGVTLPIIFITGHGDVPMSVQAMKSGAVEFLLKPFRPQELLDAVQHALDGNRKLREKTSRNGGGAKPIRKANRPRARGDGTGGFRTPQ
jgi:FixJ family two-component response regulator